MGNSSGIILELVGKSDVFVWECVGNAQGLLGNEWGIDQGLLRIIWETVDIRRGCWKMHWEFFGNSYELFGKPLVLIGNPWRISGDFWLGIHSLGEVQIQTEHIHTHAISLTKPRFPCAWLLMNHNTSSRMGHFSREPGKAPNQIKARWCNSRKL